MTAGISEMPSLRAARTSPQPHYAILAIDQDRQDKADPIKAFG
jgi:hypothetical protein